MCMHVFSVFSPLLLFYPCLSFANSGLLLLNANAGFRLRVLDAAVAFKEALTNMEAKAEAATNAAATASWQQLQGHGGRLFML